jgi:hypothetical protein
VVPMDARIALRSCRSKGAIQPLIKIGLVRWPDTIAAVVIGYTVSSSVLIGAALISGPTVEHRSHRIGICWWIAVGLCNGLTVLCMYAALRHGPVIPSTGLIPGRTTHLHLPADHFAAKRHIPAAGARRIADGCWRRRRSWRHHTAADLGLGNPAHEEKPQHEVIIHPQESIPP